MGREAPYVVEAEYVIKDAGTPRQKGREIFERLLMAPEPLVCLRFPAFDQGLILRVEAYLEVERRRNAMLSKLHGLENTGRTDHPYGRNDAKIVGHRLADLGDTVARARAAAEAAVVYALLLAAAEHREIVVRNHGRFMPLDHLGVLCLIQEVEHRLPFAIMLFRGGTLAKPSDENLALLA
jgi:hypothetical protein